MTVKEKKIDTSFPRVSILLKFLFFSVLFHNLGSVVWVRRGEDIFDKLYGHQGETIKGKRVKFDIAKEQTYTFAIVIGSCLLVVVEVVLVACCTGMVIPSPPASSATATTVV